MPDSESSFSDRAQKARNLHAACADFTPAYVAPPEGTTLAAFQNKFLACEAFNNTVAALEPLWSEAIEQRIGVVKTIKATTTQLMNYIKSSTAWKSKCPAAKRYADAIRGYKTPRPPVAPPPPGETAAKRRQRGGQSFAELETNFRALVGLAGGLAGFAPTDAKIQLSTLNGLLSSIKNLNNSIPGLEAPLGEAQQKRHKEYYEVDLGLADMFQAVKTTVKGQYGTSSTQWAQVKGMKW